jgi:signal transduction histidine kinase
VSPTELESSTGSIRERQLPEDHDPLFSSLARSAETMERWQVDYRIRGTDGLIKWLHVDAMPEPDEAHGIVWYGFVTDVTATKALEQELETHRLHLEELVQERTEQLEDARNAAESANRAKSTFLANMSHEIRTPLNAITGMAYLMQRSGATPEQASRLDKIGAASKHLLEIIDSILDLSKIEAGKLSLSNEPIQIPQLLSNVVEIMAERAASKGIRLEAQPPPACRPARRRDAAAAGADQLRGQRDQVHRAGRRHPGRTHRRDEGSHLVLRFEVRDTGIGIAPEAVGKIFRPSSRPTARPPAPTAAPAWGWRSPSGWPS